MNDTVSAEPVATEPAFDDDSALTKVDPKYRTMLRLVAAIWSVPILIAATIFEFADILPMGVVIGPVIALLVWYVIFLPGRRYLARGYAMSTDRLRVVRGLLFRSDTVVPFGRVQHLDVHQGPLERMFGLATLVVHTAGNHNSSVSQPGLPHDDAVTMREDIREHIKREAL